MAINFPASLDGTSQFGQPSGTSLLTSPDHAVLHDNLSTLGTTLETLLGTASGSNYLGTVSANQTQLGTYVVNATPTANSIPVLDANALLPQAALPYQDGWIDATGTWTYASASTITVPSGAAAIYGKGDRLKFTQHAVVKYAVVVAVADTLLTIAVNTDYVVENTGTYPITLNHYSHQANPIGYPTWFAYTPTWGGYTTNPVLNNGTLVGKVKVDGSTMTVKFELFCGASTTYGTGNYYFTLPVNPANSRQDVGSSWFLNGGTARIGVSIYNFQGASGVEFVSSTNSSVGNTSPATWASGDRLNAFFAYQF